VTQPPSQALHSRITVVGMGDCVASNDAGRTLATYALGSCIGIAAYDPQRGAGALLHFMLPESTLNPGRAQVQPAAFCDTGIRCLLERMAELGASTKHLRVYLAGAAQVIQGTDFFDIGRRNQLAAKRRLWELGLMVEDEETGGERSRTMKLHLDSGMVTVRDVLGERRLGWART
jgi:chemotaxis protein CheD